MAYGIFEELAARHMAAHYGVFIKRNWNPGDKDWVAEIDVVGLDLANRVVIMAEVKAGGLGNLTSSLDKYSGELLERVKSHFSSLGAECGIDFSAWDFRPIFYVQGSFQPKLEEAIATVPERKWTVFCLEDTLMFDEKPDRFIYSH